MEDNIQTYEVDWNSEEDGMLYAISIVDNPANYQEFVRMQEEKHKIELKEDKEKQILTGVALIPNQLIPRSSERLGNYHLKFTEETIEKLSHQYLDKGYQKNSFYNHEEALDGVTLVESWLAGENDKSKDLGFDVPKGTWMISMKLSDELWDEYIKTGKAKGFSIDSILALKKVEEKIQMKQNSFYKKNNKMSMAKNIKKYLMEALNLLEEKEQKDEKEMLTFEYEGKKFKTEKLEEGQAVLVIEDEDENPAKEMSFVVDDKEYTTDEEGKLISILDVKEKEEMEAKEKEAEELAKEKEQEEIKMKESIKLKEDKITELEGKIKDLETKHKETIDLKEAEITKLKDALEKEPSDGKVSTKINLKADEKAKLSFSERIKMINQKSKELN